MRSLFYVFYADPRPPQHSLRIYLFPGGARSKYSACAPRVQSRGPLLLLDLSRTWDSYLLANSYFLSSVWVPCKAPKIQCFYYSLAHMYLGCLARRPKALVKVASRSCAAPHELASPPKPHPRLRLPSPRRRRASSLREPRAGHAARRAPPTSTAPLSCIQTAEKSANIF